MPPLIELKDVDAGYGALSVLHDVSISVERGEVVSLLGANGAGKTTLLRAVSGEVSVQSGEILWDGQRARGGLHVRARRGLAYVTEERSVIMGLTTRENLRLGRGSVEAAVQWFPQLEALLSRRAGLLSGGEQQMLTLARALAAKPQALIIDELSLGLAPVAVKMLLPALRSAADDGVAVLLVEQAVHNALAVADRAYVMAHGSVELSGTSGELKRRLPEIEARYLSVVSDDAENGASDRKVSQISN